MKPDIWSCACILVYDFGNNTTGYSWSSASSCTLHISSGCLESLSFETKKEKSTFHKILQPLFLAHEVLSMPSQDPEYVAGMFVLWDPLVQSKCSTIGSVIDTKKSKKSKNLLILSKSRCPGNGVSTIHDTTILHSIIPSSHIHGACDHPLQMPLILHVCCLYICTLLLTPPTPICWS